MAIISCRVCKKLFYVKPSHLKLGWGKYCSKKCQSITQFNGKKVNCFLCNKIIYKSAKQLRKSKSGKYFCNRSCQTKWRNSVFSGDRNANWIDGRGAYREIMLRSSHNKPSCIFCKMEDIRVLNVHHKDHNRKNNEKGNLAWLCLNCHYLVHNSGEFDKKVRKYAKS